LWDWIKRKVATKKPVCYSEKEGGGGERTEKGGTSEEKRPQARDHDVAGTLSRKGEGKKKHEREKGARHNELR